MSSLHLFWDRWDALEILIFYVGWVTREIPKFWLQKSKCPYHQTPGGSRYLAPTRQRRGGLFLYIQIG